MISDKQLEANRSNAETDEAVRHSVSEHASAHALAHALAPYPRNTDRAGNTAGQGPRTEEGKKRSSMNALRHGITGQVTTMTDEDRAAHDKLSSALMKDLAPEGAMVTFDETVRPYPHDVRATGSTCGRQLTQRIATDSQRGHSGYQGQE